MPGEKPNQPRPQVALYDSQVVLLLNLGKYLRDGLGLCAKILYALDALFNVDPALRDCKKASWGMKVDHGMLVLSNSSAKIQTSTSFPRDLRAINPVKIKSDPETENGRR